MSKNDRWFVDPWLYDVDGKLHCKQNPDWSYPNMLYFLYSLYQVFRKSNEMMEWSLF